MRILELAEHLNIPTVGKSVASLTVDIEATALKEFSHVSPKFVRRGIDDFLATDCPNTLFVPFIRMYVEADGWAVAKRTYHGYANNETWKVSEFVWRVEGNLYRSLPANPLPYGTGSVKGGSYTYDYGDPDLFKS
jgi:hypothetical protein